MVNRYYIFKDCTQIGSTETRDEAIDMIRQRQKRETHIICSSRSSASSTAARSLFTMKKRMKKER